MKKTNTPLHFSLPKWTQKDTLSWWERVLGILFFWTRDTPKTVPDFSDNLEWHRAQAVADCIGGALTAGVWVHKSQQDEPLLFADTFHVLGVGVQDLGTGSFGLTVQIEHSDTYERAHLSLHAFLQEFFSSQYLAFKDHDA